ncbi:hypothetical protein HEBU111660_02005 [Helicobacter burdigaliensis]
MKIILTWNYICNVINANGYYGYIYNCLKKV